MSDIEVHVRSNIDALSERVLHDAFAGLVRNAIREMHAVAEFAAPERDGLLKEHIEETDVEEVVGLIEARLGVKPVEEADARPSHGRYRRSEYPMFVEGGTTTPIFAATPGGRMWNIPEGIFGRTQVRGQEAQPFMAAAYSQAKVIIDIDPSVNVALKEMAVRAAAELPLVER